MIKTLLVAGTRPNFIKLAPLYHTLSQKDWCDLKVCHTGQHYDKNMSKVFWDYLDLPEPDYFLGVSGGTVPQIIGHTTVAIAELLQAADPAFDLVIVFGDVNATIAGAIAAVQLGIKVMHVEAGLRSFDRAMPEEINRVMTDHIADLLMVSEPSGLTNLKNEGIADEKVHFIGNIMIESLVNTQPKWEVVTLPEIIENNIEDGKFILSTFHRPENVDTLPELQLVVKRLKELTTLMPVVFPVHPRTKSRLEKWNLYKELEANEKLILVPPLGYFEFIKLIDSSNMVVTDSGGIQEETTFLKKPCVTIRKNTERPVTITEGTNRLMALSNENFLQEVATHLKQVSERDLEVLKYWDNRVSERIAAAIKACFE